MWGFLGPGASQNGTLQVQLSPYETRKSMDFFHFIFPVFLPGREVGREGGSLVIHTQALILATYLGPPISRMPRVFSPKTPRADTSTVDTGVPLSLLGAQRDVFQEDFAIPICWSFHKFCDFNGS